MEQDIEVNQVGLLPNAKPESGKWFRFFVFVAFAVTFFILIFIVLYVAVFYLFGLGEPSLDKLGALAIIIYSFIPIFLIAGFLSALVALIVTRYFKKYSYEQLKESWIFRSVRLLGIVLFIIVILIIVDVLFFVLPIAKEAILFNQYGISKDQNPATCSWSAEKDQCLFNLYLKKALDNKDPKYCDELYTKFNLKTDYHPKFRFPTSSTVMIPWLSVSSYPNRCIEGYQAYHYYAEVRDLINKEEVRSFEFNENISLPCYKLEQMIGYNASYHYNVNYCLKEVQKRLYRMMRSYTLNNYIPGTGKHDPRACNNLSKMKGYNPNLQYNVENCLLMKDLWDNG